MIHLTSGQDGVSACCPDGCVSAVPTWHKWPRFTYPVSHGNHRNVNNDRELFCHISLDLCPDLNHLKCDICIVNNASVFCVRKDVTSFWLLCLSISSLVALELGYSQSQMLSKHGWCKSRISFQAEAHLIRLSKLLMSYYCLISRVWCILTGRKHVVIQSLYL